MLVASAADVENKDSKKKQKEEETRNNSDLEDRHFMNVLIYILVLIIFSLNIGFICC